jgi:hypothetical protein
MNIKKTKTAHNNVSCFLFVVTLRQAQRDYTVL